MKTVATKTLQAAMVLGCCWCVPDALATTVHAVHVSAKDCQLDNKTMVCQLSYQPTIKAGRDKLTLKADDGVVFHSSADGRLAFRASDDVQGVLSINDQAVSDLPVQDLDVADEYPPLRLHLQYHLTSSAAGLYQVPAMTLLHFSDGTEHHQVFVNAFEIKQPAVCAFRQKNQTLELTSIETNNIRHKDDTYPAGKFSLDIDCNGSGVDVQMAFKDALQPSNTSKILSTKQGTGQAVGVGLLFKHADKDVYFSPEPANIDKPAVNQWQVSNTAGGHYQSDFAVHYVNTDGIVHAGRVQGNIIATIAFK